MTDLSGSLVAFDLSGADYAAAPLSAATQTVEYPSDNNWTYANFGTPISNLRLYAVYWRGMGGEELQPDLHVYCPVYHLIWVYRYLSEWE